MAVRGLTVPGDRAVLVANADDLKVDVVGVSAAGHHRVQLLARLPPVARPWVMSTETPWAVGTVEAYWNSTLGRRGRPDGGSYGGCGCAARPARRGHDADRADRRTWPVLTHEAGITAQLRVGRN